MSLDKEFQQFMTEELSPSHALNQDTQVFLQSCARPLPVVTKFTLIQLIASVMTLSICPQFGLGTSNHTLLHFVAHYGEAVCGAFCGLIFFGISGLISSLTLQKGEGQWLYRKRYSVISLLLSLIFVGLMSVKHFMAVKAMHDSTSYYSSWIVTSWAIMLMISTLVWHFRWNPANQVARG